MLKKLLCALLCLCTILSIVTVSAFADGCDVARIGNKTYASLQDAVNDSENGDTIVLIRDIVIEIPDAKLNATYDYCQIWYKTLTFDLNGKTISWGESAAAQTATKDDIVFYIRNSTVTLTGNGTIDGTNVGSMYSYSACLSTSSRLTIKNGTYRGSETVFYIYSGSEKNGFIDGGEITIEGGYIENDVTENYGQTLNVSGFIGENGFQDNKRIVMKGGTIVNVDPRYLNDGNAVPNGYAVCKVKVNDSKREYTVVPKSQVISYYTDTLEDVDSSWNYISKWEEIHEQAFPTTETYAIASEGFTTALIGTESATVKLPTKDTAAFDTALDTYKLQLLAGDTGFSDVAKTDWFYSDVTSLTSKGIVSGYPDGTFKPYGEVTWGEALKLVLKANGFGDIPATGDHWASGYMDKAIELGYISGAVDLNAAITRGEMADLCAAAMKLGSATIASPFADDAPASAVALYEAGIIKGSADNGQLLYRADSTITRAEISAIIWRMVKAR